MPKNEKAETKTEAAPASRGRAVILPNGERRVDFIQKHYYHADEKKAKTRSEITKMVNDLYPVDDDGRIPYQIVFAATKLSFDDFTASKADKAKKAAAAKEETAKEATKDAA